jgi:deoxyribodipyrimidine photo-lyase
MPEFRRALCWFRRDLRDHDHSALAAALGRTGQVACAFVFDTDILDALEHRADRRVEFILAAVTELDRSLRRHGGGLIVRHGRAARLIPELAVQLGVEAVLVSRDYEPAAKERDAEVARALSAHGIRFVEHKDQVVFERDEILTRAGKPFGVFTPYKNAWLAALRAHHLEPRVVAPSPGALLPDPERALLPTLQSLGFEPTNLAQTGIAVGMSGARRMFASFCERMDRYAGTRDQPAANGTSNLSVHLRFGTLSVRTVAAEAHARMLAGGADAAGAATWLSELVWRDFYFMVLDHHPEVVDHAFKPEFDAIRFPNDRGHFDAWRAGRTGYPLVDAGMRQLATTGMMHNRLRMVAASFLVKDLHVDWRWGERHFAANLNDYDLAANNGGWQWAASTGCDAQPYFRIFNPVTQSERFDPRGTYIRRFVPELTRVPDAFIHAPWKMPPLVQQDAGCAVGVDYPLPIVDHDVARKGALALFAVRSRGTG